jgi:hypothetical protein
MEVPLGAWKGLTELGRRARLRGTQARVTPGPDVGGLGVAALSSDRRGSRVLGEVLAGAALNGALGAYGSPSIPAPTPRGLGD